MTPSHTLRDELQALADTIKARHLAQAQARPQRPPVAHPEPTPGPTLEDYRKALASHDWTYDYSDDYSVWCRGRDSLARLQAMARTLDPGLVIWREYAR